MVSVQIAALVAALSAGGETALLDFHAPWCAPCRSMDGVIAGLERAGYPIRKINVDSDRHLADQFNVKSVPCFVMVVDGREAGRLTGAASREELERLFARAGVRRSGGATTRAQSPDPAPPSARTPGPAHVPAARGRGVTAEDLIAASVRLTITDPAGSSFGSGTLIDARQGEALVLTCGHIFRDSQGKGQIAVDLCAPGGPQKLPGRLVSYDLKNDVALVSIRPGVPVRVASLAPKGHRPAAGERVITVGCNNGGPATAQHSSVTAVNKFLAPANVSVAGLPVQGRSGGGLFTAEGEVIGVCNAADPADNEGLYAALSVIHDELDEAGLTAIYEQRGPPETLAGGGPRPEAAGASDLAQVVPAALSEASEQGDSAEVICIIRPLSSPGAKSEVIMLDRASTELLQQLAADRAAQEARHLTSLRSQHAPRRQPAR